MKSNIELVKEALAVAEAGDMKKLAGLVTDDMTFEGPMPEPQPKAAYLGMLGALLHAIPNWKFDAKNFVEKGDQVSAIFNVNGTHTDTLTLPMLTKPLPATGKRFQVAAEPVEFTFKGGKISRIKVEAVPGGGVMDILAQLGVTLPVA